MNKISRLKWKGNRKHFKCLQSCLAMVVMFAMLCTSMPVTLLGSLASYTVYVGGAEMTVNADGSSTAYYVNGVEGAQGTVSTDAPESWNAKLYYDTTAGSVVLETDGLVVKNDHTQNKPVIDSGSEVPMRLVLKNNPSTIGGGESVLNASTYALCCGGDLTIDIQVSGSLFQGIDVTTQQSSGQGSYAIYSEGDIVINSADSAYELTAVSGKGAGISYGIYTAETLTMNGGTIYATSGGGGTYMNAGIRGKNVIINDGTVLHAKGSTSGKESYGIYAGMNMTIYDGAEVYAEGGGNASEVSIAAGFASGDWGSFTIEGGIFEAVGKEADDSYGVDAGVMGDASVIRGGFVKIISEAGTRYSYAVRENIAVIGGSVIFSCNENATDKKIADSITFSDAEQTNDTWYKWTTTDGGSMTNSKDTLYSLNASDCYLKIEKDVPHIHTICGKDSCSLDHDKDGNADGHTGIEFVPWDGTGTDANNDVRQLTTGNYYLSSNVTIDSTVMIDGTVNLCLNGYALKYENADTNGSVIQVNAGATLNLCDCNGSNSSHNITAPITSEAVTITGGLITGGTGKDYSNNVYYGGGIYVEGTAATNLIDAVVGTVHQYGGTIAGNEATSGSGVSVMDSIYHMYGGNIAYNKASWTESAVYVNGNEKNTDGSYSTEFTMSGNSRVASNKGCGIWANSGTLVSMSENAMVEGNQNHTYGGAGICLYSNTNGLHMSGNAVVCNNQTSGARAGGVYVFTGSGTGDIKLSGNVQITENTSTSSGAVKAANMEISCYNGVQLQVEELSEDAIIPIKITKSEEPFTEVFTLGGGAYLENFVSEMAGCFIEKDETANELKFVSYQITEEPSRGNDYKIDVNYETGVQYEWYEVELEDVTLENATVYEDQGYASSFDGEQWTCHTTTQSGTPGYFNIPMSAGDRLLIEVSHGAEYGSMRIYDNESRAQAWVSFGDDLNYSLTAPEDGTYSFYISNTTDEVEQPTVKAKLFHFADEVGNRTNQLTGATSGKNYICKVTYDDGTVLFSEPFTYIGPITGVSAENTTVSYDGQPHSITVTAPAGTVITYRTSENESYSTTNPEYTEVGTYTVYYKVSMENYEDFTSSAQLVIRGKLDAPVTLSSVAETMLGKADGKITGLTTEMEYSTSGNGPFTKVTDVNRNFAAGTYYVRYAEKQNYDASDVVSVIVPKGPAVQITTPENPNFDLRFDKEELGWQEDVTITLTPKDGYTLTPAPEVKVNGIEVEVDIQPNQKAVFTVEDVEGNIYIEATGIIDITAPTIKIEVAENTWNKFWNELTFGILFNETQTVTITATDAGSGIDKVYYYQSKKALTLEEVNALTDWTEYKKAFDINPENEFILYAKAIDKEGNVAYINSDNLILLIPGNYEDVTPDTNLGSAKLDADIEELKQDIPFTQKELEMVKMGADVDIWLQVEDISKTVSDTDKELIEEKLGENQIGMYIDVSMFKQVGRNPAEKLTQLNDKISITFEVPTALILDSTTYTRTYQIMRLHENVAELLDTKYDSQKQTLTFETDCFSTYAVLYKDEAVNDAPVTPPAEKPPVEMPPTEEPPTETPPTEVPPVEKPSTEVPPVEEPSTEEPPAEQSPETTPTAPKTTDSGFILWIALLFVSGGLMYQCIVNNKSENKK